MKLSSRQIHNDGYMPSKAALHVEELESDREAEEVEVGIYGFADATNVMKLTQFNNCWGLVRKDLRSFVAYLALENKRGHEVVDERVIARYVAEGHRSFQLPREVVVVQYSFANNFYEDDWFEKGVWCGQEPWGWA